MYNIIPTHNKQSFNPLIYFTDSFEALDSDNLKNLAINQDCMQVVTGHDNEAAVISIVRASSIIPTHKTHLSNPKTMQHI